MFLFTFISILPMLASCGYHRFKQNTQCECVLPHLCENDKEDVAVHGFGLLEPRIDQRRCANPEEICCKKLKSSETKVPRCGYSAQIKKSRITSDRTASFAELPWSLIIQEDEGAEKTLYKCGASLIHPKVAITAAHCVTSFAEQPEKLLVRAGEHNIFTQNEPLPHQDRGVEEILIHPNFHPASLWNDIAILILNESFNLQDNIAIICLSTPSDFIFENSCVVSGWGKDVHDKGKYSSILKKAQVPIVVRDLCLESLRRTRLGRRFNLHKSFICAGSKTEDACKGDGGSPLICPLLENRERLVQIGIVSWGIGCGTKGVPGVYVNVPLYMEWIEEEMRERDLDSGYFKI